jgi:hypothetical protein
MSALRGRDKRAQRINAVEQKRTACERDMQGDPDDDSTPYDFDGLTNQDDPNIDDINYFEARRMY